MADDLPKLDPNVAPGVETQPPGEGSPAATSSLEDMRRWQQRVITARKLRENWEFEWQVEKCENFYLGRQAIELGELVLNYVYSTIQTQRPNLLLNSPKYMVRSQQGNVSPVTDRQAAIGEGLLSYIANNEFNLEKAGDLALTQSYFRVGVLKCVYDPQLEPNPQAGEPIYEVNEGGEPVVDPASMRPLIGPDGQPVINQMTGQPTIDPTSIQWKPMVDPQTGQPLTEPDHIVNEETYRWEWVDAKNLLLPDEGPDDTKWTWIGEEVAVPLAVAKEDERFPQELRDKFTANESPADRVRRRGNVLQALSAEQDPLPDEEIFRYFECYDIKNKRFYAFADGQLFDEFLINDVLPDGIEDHPYSLLRWDLILGPRPNSWPVPHIFNWLPIQREYNIRRQQIAEGAKRSARKILYDASTFDDPDEAVKALQSSRDMESAKVRDVAHPPHMMESHEISGDIYRDIPLLLTDWYTITGQTGARLGTPQSETATEASFVERSGNLRDTDMQREVMRWLSIAGSKMLQLVQKTLTLGLWVRMRGWDDKEILEYAQRVYGVTPDTIKMFPGIREALQERLGQEQMTHVTREHLTFKADVQVIAGSSRPRNLDVERSQFFEVLQLIGQFPQLALSRELMREVSQTFEFVSQRTMDELAALAQKMIMMQQITAGHGGAGGAPQNTKQQPQPKRTQAAVSSATYAKGNGGGAY